ncbi:Uncharacterized protein TCM_018043 [Theobroma cacao]|uniref:Uncharacterized protein n=1 Tax=Theobroma cacao TaxID=3641 RepID=A0A061EF76_THECC|nr:Uncharacterized protein TCM_018043 [Theobroma cacao]
MTPSVNRKVVNYLTHQHTIKDVFDASLDGAKLVIHIEFGEKNLVVKFDVEEQPKIPLGDCGVVGAIQANGVSDDKVKDTIKETKPRAARATSIVRWKINKGLVAYTDQPLYTNDYLILASVLVLLYQGFMIKLPTHPRPRLRRYLPTTFSRAFSTGGKGEASGKGVL